MKTKEQNMTKGMISLLIFVSVLVFCSFVVSNRITDILYFLVLISYIVYYKRKGNSDVEETESPIIR